MKPKGFSENKFIPETEIALRNLSQKTKSLRSSRVFWLQQETKSLKYINIIICYLLLCYTRSTDSILKHYATFTYITEKFPTALNHVHYYQFFSKSDSSKNALEKWRSESKMCMGILSKNYTKKIVHSDPSLLFRKDSNPSSAGILLFDEYRNIYAHKNPLSICCPCFILTGEMIGLLIKNLCTTSIDYNIL
ncbi:hypothetical protein F8M41_006352 [Gigaspora margarita]|uniref:Uncharacterized protein n=1 Tax=Gigaspora margarita TaxID=4874 RepID=A0A8H3X6L8_GIGMA|nr:hypothetical protein F8M41_006352 [Gigaspora margarita]